MNKFEYIRNLHYSGLSKNIDEAMSKLTDEELENIGKTGYYTTSSDILRELWKRYKRCKKEIAIIKEF
jgi:hypothetical protein